MGCQLALNPNLAVSTTQFAPDTPSYLVEDGLLKNWLLSRANTRVARNLLTYCVCYFEPRTLCTIASIGNTDSSIQQSMSIGENFQPEFCPSLNDSTGKLSARLQPSRISYLSAKSHDMEDGAVLLVNCIGLSIVLTLICISYIT